MFLVYASTIVTITWIISRAVGSLTGNLNFRQSIDVLNETFDDVGPATTDSATDIIGTISDGASPWWPTSCPPTRSRCFTRNERLGRFVSSGRLAPAIEEDVSDLVELPQLDRALRTDSVVLDESYCVIPVGYCADGELVMVVRRSELRPTGRQPDRVRRPSCWPRPSCG